MRRDEIKASMARRGMAEHETAWNGMNIMIPQEHEHEYEYRYE